MDATTIRETRRALGLTQAELGRLVERSQATISAVERGENAPPSLLRRLAEALEQARGTATEQAPRSGGRLSRSDWVLPDFPLSRADLTLPVETARWGRPEHSGDFFFISPLPPDSLLLVAVDMAGHGPGLLPASLFVRGWLRGWTQSLGSPPRLQSLAQELGRELRSTGLEASCYFALLTAQRGRAHTVSYEGLSCGYPPPLLISGPPFRTLESAVPGPPLPSEILSDQPVRIDRLDAPWHLLVASDGLLARVGGGSEPRGIRSLREWQTGSDRNVPPEQFFETPIPVTDDESFLGVRWSKWDLSFTFPVGDGEERHRALRSIAQRVENRCGERLGYGFQQAALEAISNAWEHGYRGAGDGIVRVRFREESERLRVEVEDEGIDHVSDDKVRHGRGGFAAMRHWADVVDASKGPAGGTIITLVLETKSTEK
jgi:anti-sigma regulatory factor (Ser/Thr protein kinase)/transcriptional regulator with XRE-family HTH domain